MPPDPIPDLVPDLAVEVLSESNTCAEMSKKRGEYFSAGVRLVWLVEPDDRTVTIFTGAGQPRVFRDGEVLDGRNVLPEFALNLSNLFAELEL